MSHGNINVQHNYTFDFVMKRIFVYTLLVHNLTSKY